MLMVFIIEWFLRALHAASALAPRFEIERTNLMRQATAIVRERTHA
jgi:hypothetical protein